MGRDGDLTEGPTLGGNSTRLSPRKSVEIPPALKLNISDTIVQVAGWKENLCMFASIYNALRCPETRLAFAAGNIERPAAAFVQSAMANTRIQDRERYGYTSFDMRLYLRRLEEAGIIAQYTWKLARADVWSRLFVQKKGWRSQNCAVVVFGATMPSTERKAMERRFKKEAEKWTRVGEKRKQKEMIKYYESGMPKHVAALVKNRELIHGVALNRDEDGRVFLYDNGRQKRREVRGIEDVAVILATYWRAYILEIEVP